MSKKSERIERKAKATVAARHAADSKAEVDTSQSQPVNTRPKKVAKIAKEGAMPALPKLPSASKARKPKPMHDCACGCGTQTRSQWAPGHDARAKGWALRIEREILTIKDVPENERPGALLMLKARKELGTTGKITLAKGNKGATKPEPATATASVIPDTEVVNE